MTNRLEKRLNQIQNIRADAENSIKVMKENPSQFPEDVIHQKELFIQKITDEEKALLEELGVNDKPKKVGRPKKDKKEEDTKVEE